MALPTSMVRSTPGRHAASGLMLELYPSTQGGLSVELQMATANSTASSAWTSILFPPSSAATLRFTQRVPDTTKTYYFRARHPAQAGYSAGAFTPTVHGKPDLIPDIQPRIVPQVVSNGDVQIPSNSHLWLSSGKTIKVGTPVTTGVQIKTLRIPFGEALPDSSTQSWDVNAGHLRCGVANKQLTARAVAIPPLNVRLRAWRNSLYRFSSVNDVAKVRIDRLVSPDTLTPLSTAVHAVASGWATVSSTLNETASTGRAYLLTITLKGVATRADARWSFAEIDYETHTYTETL